MQFWVRKLGGQSDFFEIAGLRHFLPRRHLLGFFLAFFAWRFGGPWVSLGRLLGFLRLSWEASGPKNV